MHHSLDLEALMNPWGPSFGQGKEKKSLWPQCWLLRAQPLDVTPEKVAFSTHSTAGREKCDGMGQCSW